MKILTVELTNFRNHSNSKVYLSPKINIIYGPNGAGKTSILEAISIASLTRPFSNAPDSVLLKNGETNYEIKVDCTNYLNQHYFVQVFYEKSSGKKISNSFQENIRFKDILGLLPIVFLSPDLKIITSGAPENRREFMDRILSQSSRTYVEDVLKLKKTLKQRNSLLSNYKLNKAFDRYAFETWTELFIQLSSSIVRKRIEFIKDFNLSFQKYYQRITNNAEVVEILYKPNSIVNTDESIEEQYYSKAKKLFETELQRATTLFGPQKDELYIQLNNGIAREWGSQGQHKSLLIAIKLAEFDYLQKFTNEVPIVLLDDIFSELDEYRSSLVLETILDNNAQTLITSTSTTIVNNNQKLKNISNLIKVENGEIR